MAGNVEMMFGGLGSSAGYAKGGRIQALMVSGSKRNPAFPDVQARAIEEIRRAASTNQTKALWAKQVAEFPGLIGASFGRFVNGEVRRWAPVVKTSGAKLD